MIDVGTTGQVEDHEPTREEQGKDAGGGARPEGWGGKGNLAYSQKSGRDLQKKAAKAIVDCVVNVRGDSIVKNMLSGDFGCKRCRL